MLSASTPIVRFSKLSSCRPRAKSLRHGSATMHGQQDKSRIPLPTLSQDPMRISTCLCQSHQRSSKTMSCRNPYLFVRTTSKRKLINEARTLRHRMSHFPFNPYCEECLMANLRQRRYARSSGREDDGLPVLTGPGQQYSTDTMIVSKSRTDDKRKGSGGEIVALTIRDSYSGLGFARSLTDREASSLIPTYKFVAGPAVRNPSVVVKSDAEPGIISSIETLRWHPEPSIANRWPHNTTHERWHGSVKSVERSSICQSGFPSDAWGICVSFATTALGITQQAPIMPHEKNAAGEALPEHQHKIGKTC